MKRKNIKVVVVLLMIIEIISLFLTYQSFTNSKPNLNKTDKFQKSEVFAIMIEQGDGTYKEDYNINKWPSTGYIYNSELSGCVDLSGNKLTGILNYDLNNNVAEVMTNESVTCYLYFDRLPVAYAIYSATDKSLSFVKTKEEISVGDTYNDKVVTAVYTGIEDKIYTTSNIPWDIYERSITKVEVLDEISPISTAYWFQWCYNASYFDLSNLNTSNVTTFQHMFYYAGGDASKVEIIGLENWDTSNVTDMAGLFGGVGDNASEVYIDGLENWNTSNVTNMDGVFVYVGHYNATTVDIGDISGWDTSNVTDMENMFYYMGPKAAYSLDLSGWDVSKVTSYKDFNGGVSTKVIAPTWVN